MSPTHHPLSNYFSAMQGERSTVIWRGYKVFLFKQIWGELAIAEQGAQVLHYQPKDSRALLWLSEESAGPGKAIRGGIPLCWPWFGAHPSLPDQPSHGLARTANWSVIEETHNSEQSHWTLRAPELVDGITLELHIRADGVQLKVQLTTENKRSQAYPITQALHSYLQLSDTRNIQIHGPETEAYYDKLAQCYTRGQEHHWDMAMDRIYQHQGDTRLLDQGLKRQLNIAKENSQSTVIWNPGSDSPPADIAPSQLSAFICIEAANTEQYDPVTLAPGQSVSISTTLEHQPPE
ncbi:D-hexose-6-phosphate mutarotase [Pseudoteredinibacter isoporae]|uniref:Putative glucose-6-phosphate 1-epimerase n=1 Tax=Pseudoteredinibacter isoporae TaxID=570281 RepID=A0A7X0MUI6_9GAMM|nr:D-hexose-6-phosphate mutarotase [Pseudoteredinibacter isoporae]MBB6520065.1 D-hexose-6-phosphate mutarotase [Pseudoteredinibacter isoporae]NHO85637.1 D-hexose-6-phosphate mutarotase [Pseudoteredinibacter isoporae]NIB25911.1 D-hexose-6-phosphate mutarotase [Pseudoteredinibacter isoporae]